MIRIVLLSLLLASVSCMWAQRPDSSVVTFKAIPTMPVLWVEMPDSLMPLLAQRERMDARDYVQSGMRAELTNTLGGKSVLETLTDEWIQVKLTPSSTWEARLLPLADGNRIICVIHTIAAKQPHSAITCYTTAWQSLSAEHYLPAALCMQDDHMWNRLQFSADSLTLIHHSTYLQPTAPGEASYATTTQRYTWRNERFVPLEGNLMP